MTAVPVEVEPSSRSSRDPLLRLLVGAGVIFVLLVALELHGYSLPYWHVLVEGREAPEVLVGQPRVFRWDDYAVQLPQALGQRAHEPPFPVVNENVGLGQNMLVPTPLPVAHVATLFRPATWGFFLGADGKRALLGLTVAEALLVVRFADSAHAGRRGARAGHVVLAAAWMLALGPCAVRLQRELPGLHPAGLALAASLNGLAVYALTRGWRVGAVVGGVVLALGASALWFNPLVRGGAGYLRTNPLAQRVVELDRASGGQSVWAVYGQSALASLLVADGVQVVNGEQAIPQLELWGRLDPTRQHLKKYDRYAVVHLYWPPPAGQPAGIGQDGDSDVTFFLHPEEGHLPRLGVTHLLVSAEPGTELAEFFEAYEPLARVGTHATFPLPLRRAERR